VLKLVGAADYKLESGEVEAGSGQISGNRQFRTRAVGAVTSFEIEG
jgi:hypothetical protein